MWAASTVDDGAARPFSTWSLCLLGALIAYGFLGALLARGGGGASLSEASAAGNSTAQGLLLACLAGALPVLFRYRHEALRLAVQCWPLLLVVAWQAISVRWSPYPDISLRRVAALAIFLVIAGAAVVATDHPRRLVVMLGAIMAVVIAADWLVYVALPRLAQDIQGIKGVHSAKNDAGTVSMVAVLLCGGIALAAPSRGSRLLFAASAVAAFGFLLLTRSKTTVALTLLLMVAAPAGYVVASRSRGLFMLALVAVISAAAAMLLLVLLLDVRTETILTLVFGDPTLTRRTELWHHLLYTIREHPLFGVGWGAFWGVGLTLNPIHGLPDQWFMNASLINTAHNGYLDVLLQGGAIGLALVVVMLLRTLVSLGDLVQRQPARSQARVLLATLLVVYVGLLLNNGTESRLLGPNDMIARILEVIVIGTAWWQARLPRRDAARMPAAMPVPSLERFPQ